MSIFGKLLGSGIGVTKVQGDFGATLSVRGVLRPKQQRAPSKMGSPETAISEMKGTIRNTLL